MRARVARYRKEPLDVRTDYSIGCRILEQPFFWPRELWLPIADRWAPSIVVGKGFDTVAADGRYLWDAVRERLAATALAPSNPLFEVARYGDPRLVQPRLGQGTFRVAVTDSYSRRCAVTGERTLPVLDAAHIKAYGAGGDHEVSNGILFRSDIHKLRPTEGENSGGRTIDRKQVGLGARLGSESEDRSKDKKLAQDEHSSDFFPTRDELSHETETDQCAAADVRLPRQPTAARSARLRRRIVAPMTPKPAIIIAQEAGSGTAPAGAAKFNNPSVMGPR